MEDFQNKKLERIKSAREEIVEGVQVFLKATLDKFLDESLEEFLKKSLNE